MRRRPGTKLLTKHSTRWWTRERVVEGLRRFAEDFGETPSDTDAYDRMKAFTGVVRNGSHSRAGHEQKYPSGPAIRMYFPTICDAWRAAGYEVTPEDRPWEPLEEWFIAESVGILPREEVARLLGRSVFAIKAHLYHMGLNSHNRWGWPLNKAQRLLGVSAATLKRYINHGRIAVLNGLRRTFIDPGDLLVVTEYDWSKKSHPPELEEAVRKSLMLRLCHLLLRRDWRERRPHQPQPLKAYYAGRMKKPRPPSAPPGPRPTHVETGDWVRFSKRAPAWAAAAQRKGQVKSLQWSPQRRKALDGFPAREPCWMATVEFRRETRADGAELPRLRFNVPAAVLARTKAPRQPARKLSDHPNTVYKRRRMEERGSRRMYLDAGRRVVSTIGGTVRESAPAAATKQKARAGASGR